MDRDNNQQPIADEPAPASSPPPESQAAGAATPTGETAPAPPAAAKKRRVPMVAIVLAVVVAGLLAALTIFAYQRTDAPAYDKKPAVPPAETVSGADVNALKQTVGNVLGELNEAADFPEAELADPTLGL